jgi:hypothetical protein
MTGNRLGWLVYAYYTRDPFVVASNLPGFILSIWLNLGAAKLQYLALMQDEKFKYRSIQQRRTSLDADSAVEDDPEDLVPQAMQMNPGSLEQVVMVPQERALLRILVFWAIVLIYAGWINPSHQAKIVGTVVTVNQVFFYGAPLQTMRTVVVQRSSESIHVPTMVLNSFNTSFWIAYGFARTDLIIVLSNAIGLAFGLSQGLLCLIYPRSKRPEEVQLLNDNQDGREATFPYESS